MKINDLTHSQDLTEKARSVLNDLKNKTTHPAPCCCVPCLYFEYLKGSRGRGRPVKGLMFFLAWLIHRVKVEYLEKSGKAKRVVINGKEVLQWRWGRNYYEKTPFLTRTNEILGEILDEILNIDFLEAPIISYSMINIYKLRIEKLNFLKLEEELIKRRNLEWLKSQPKEMRIWERNWDDLKLAQRAANFINSRPGKKIIQRDLQRSLSSKKKRIKKEDIERIRDNLGNFGINVKDEEGCRKTTTIYYSTMKNTRGRYWRVGV